MPVVTAYEDVPNPRIQRNLANGHFAWRTDFLKRPEDKSLDVPMAFLAEGSAHRTLRAHFHVCDQFQIIYKGDGKMGTHPIAFGGVHFSRAYTPYGPISYGDQGLGFITLRAHRDPGAQYMPDARPVLDAVQDRKPWQITVMADFDLKPGESGVAMKAVDGVHDDRGLSAFSIVMKPGAKCFAPDPSKGDGQYIVIMKGGIRHEGKDKKDLTVIWVAKDEGPFQLEAGPEGCSALAVTFPVPGGGIPQEHKLVPTDGKGDFKTYQCILCAFVYDEEKGYPEMGLAPGTRWADVPDSFKCPDCEAMKADFEVIEF